MRYPSYPSQPYTGDLPSMVAVGPSDARYSSSVAPRYAAPFDRRYGRKLAGTDTDVSDESADPGYASNELALLAEMDDIQANGIFDPPGTHPNVHPDAGVFAARYSLPGYHAREVPFSKSEVVDATTGRRVVGVPSGAVALDSAAQIAFIEQGLYQTPQNVVDWQSASPMPGVSIANWMQNPQSVGPSGYGPPVAPTATPLPVHGYGYYGDAAATPAPIATPAASTTTSVLGTVVIVGLSAGVLYALLRKKK
jgi:hypothetical protein